MSPLKKLIGKVIKIDIIRAASSLDVDIDTNNQLGDANVFIGFNQAEVSKASKA